MKYTAIILLLLCSCASSSRQPWPDGEIPFIIVGFSPDESATIIKSMATWQILTNNAVKFIPDYQYHGDTNPLWIMCADDNSSAAGVSVGAGYDPDAINATMLSKVDAFSVGHELGHVLGLQHEFIRPDRDAYITITIDPYVPLLHVWQFVPAVPVFYKFNKYPFDYQSIMMYGEYPADGITIDGKGHDLSGDTPTWVDAWKVRDIYGEPAGL
jgi:hypothetical protein